MARGRAGEGPGHSNKGLSLQRAIPPRPRLRGPPLALIGRSPCPSAPPPLPGSAAAQAASSRPPSPLPPPPPPPGPVQPQAGSPFPSPSPPGSRAPTAPSPPLPRRRDAPPCARGPAPAPRRRRPGRSGRHQPRYRSAGGGGLGGDAGVPERGTGPGRRRAGRDPSGLRVCGGLEPGTRRQSLAGQGSLGAWMRGVSGVHVPIVSCSITSKRVADTCCRPGAAGMYGFRSGRGSDIGVTVSVWAESPN